jgi:Flp pilus assembly protein CpaB
MPTLVRPSMRPRRRLHQPVPYWLVVAVIAVVPALAVGRLATTADAERRRWGPGLPTVVVRVDVAAGEPIGADDVEIRSLPAAARPDDAMGTLPTGAVAAADLVAGEAVVGSRLAPAGTSPIAARLPSGTRGIAVPADDGLAVRVGDRVDVLATLDATSGQPTTTLARGATVVDVGEKAVTVAVPVEQAERVAFALAAGVVTLALTGP